MLANRKTICRYDGVEGKIKKKKTGKMEGKSLSRNGRILEESCSRVDDEWP